MFGDIPEWKQIPDRKQQNKAYFLYGEYTIRWENVCQVIRIRDGFALIFGSGSYGFVGIRADSLILGCGEKTLAQQSTRIPMI